MTEIRCRRKIELFASAEERILALLVTSMCLQQLDVISLGTGGVQLSHIIAICVALCIAASIGVAAFLKTFLSQPILPLTAVVFYFVLDSVYLLPENGTDPLVLNYVFLLLGVALSYLIARELKWDRVVHVIRLSAMFVLALVVSNALLHSGSIVDYWVSRWDGHPNYPTIFDGGVNLEVTWPAMFGVFFSLDRWGVGYNLAVLFLSVLLSSRAGAILSVMSLLFLMAKTKKYSPKRKIRIVLAVLSSMIVAALVLSLIGVPLLERFSTIGADGGSLGRMSIWSYAVKALSDSPLFGYGAGNAMDAVRELSGVAFQENNVHNIYLQVATDFGMFGLILYFALIGFFVWKVIAGRRVDESAAYLIEYLMVGLIQFRGGEPLIALMVGIWLAKLFHRKPGCKDD